MFTYQDYCKSADFIRTKIGDFKPDVLVILGSGLGFIGDDVLNKVYVDYSEIPNFKTSTAPGHAGRFVFGELSGKNVMVMQGRFHMYEGYTAQEVTIPVRVAKLLGATSMIVTNACGAVNETYNVGDLVLLKDYIKVYDFDPLIGPNIPEFGPRFCDMSYTYNKEYIQLAKQIGEKQKLSVREGVYFFFTGPQFETPAEIRVARILGSDLVGMSTVPESIVANHTGMKILGVSLVTNMAAGVLDQPLSEDEVVETATKSRIYFSKFILEFLEQM